MDNLVTVQLDNPREAKSRKEVIDGFVNNFLKKELSSVSEAGNITQTDQLMFPGYFISRVDLIQMLSDISSDIMFENIPFKKVLDKILTDQKVKDSAKNNIGVGINFGYGLSREIPKKAPKPKIRMSKELQVVFDAIGKVEPDKPARMVSSYTTANIRAFNPPITPPNGGTPYPPTVI